MIRRVATLLMLVLGFCLFSPAHADAKVKQVLAKVPKALLVTAPKAVVTNQPVGGLVGSIVYVGGYVVDGVQAITNALDGGDPGSVTKKVNPLHYVNVVVNRVDDGFDAAEQFYGISH